MNRTVVRLGLIAALCYMSVNMATEVITHAEAKDHAGSVVGLVFCLAILLALILLQPRLLVRVATALSAMIATASLYVLGIYLLKHGLAWSEAKDFLTRALFAVVVPLIAVGYFAANARASRISRSGEGSPPASAAESLQPLVYDYGDRGARILSYSVPLLVGLALFMMLLAISCPFTSGASGSVLLQGLFLFGVGAWMGLLGLHYRRDKQAFNTRYVLTEAGVDITPPGSAPQSVVWPQVSAAYRSRLLRYFRLVSPMTPDIVLVFGTPPRPDGTAQMKYAHTRTFLAEHLKDRLTTTWL